MRVVFAGTPQVAIPSLRALIASDHEVVAVVTRPDAPAGRGRGMRQSPVREVAEEHGIPVLTPRRARDPEFLEQLTQLAPDACPVVAYGALLPRSVLDVPRHGWVNLHFSLLPAWRGAAPVQHAVIAGDEATGATTFLIEEGLDTGPVLGTMTESIRPRDTSGDLLERLAAGGAGLLVASLDGLADGSITPVAQSAEGVSQAPKLSVEDARVVWDRPGFAIERQIRGCTPAPGAWTTFRGERLKLGPSAPAEAQPDADEERLAPGALRATKHAVQVGTGAGRLELGTVQPNGKKPMNAADWARGVRIQPGEVLGA